MQLNKPKNETYQYTSYLSYHIRNKNVIFIDIFMGKPLRYIVNYNQGHD